jgi:galactokinase
MTGGGFGGCLVAVLPAEGVNALCAAIREHWDTAGIEHQLLIAVRPSAGAALL